MFPMLNENTLLLTDPNQRGQNTTQLLNNIENLPEGIKQTVIKAIVQSSTPLPSGQSQLLLPSGQVFLAEIPEQLPQGSQLLLLRASTKPTQDQSIQLLRVVLPQMADVKPAPNPPILLEVAQQIQPQEGQTINFKPPVSTTTSALLPAPGASVMGKMTSIPQNGLQEVTLANGNKLQIILPPTFEKNTELVLRLNNQQQATIEKLTLPTPPQAKEAIVHNQGQIKQPHPSQIQVQQQLEPKTQFTLTIPKPSVVQHNIVYNANIEQIEGSKVTLKLENGVSLNLQQEIGQSRQVGTTMSIRFTESGLLEVLKVTATQPIIAVKDNDPNQADQRNQQQHKAPPATTEQTPRQLPVGKITTGTVVEQRPNGELILQFGQENSGVKVPVKAQRLLPVGSQISIRIMADGHAEIIDMTLPKGTERSNTLMRFAVVWDSLNNTIDTIRDKSPDLVDKVIKSLPRADETLLPKLIQFTQATAQQNLRIFFGDEVINILRALGLDGALQNDLGQLNTLQQRQDTPDAWRTVLFPYWDDQEQRLRQGGFFWRRQQENNDSEDSSLRFVLNVQLSALGHVQLDGLMQGNDIIHLKLRTAQPLDAKEKERLSELVENSLNRIDMHGSIVVEDVDFFEVDPLHETLTMASSDSSISAMNRLNVEA